jgi:hypothetical protein
MRGYVAGGSVLLVVLLAACDSGSAVSGPDTGGDPIPAPNVVFNPPIDGVPNASIFYGAYFDQASDGNRLDYACGAKSYDGHRGTDILLRNFVVQDSGVGVVAAAAGTVRVVEDGVGDRSTVNGFGGFGNHVVIEHAPRLRTVYAHLRRHSIRVEVGDEVAGGQRLGLVGSSGDSNWPHLHFEVREAGGPVDPYAGPCNTEPGRWRDQLAYQDSVMVLDGGVTTEPVSSLRVLLERPSPAESVSAEEPSVSVWVQLFNAPRSMVAFVVRDPAGRRHAEIEQPFGGTFSIWYASLTLPVAGEMTTEGRWGVAFSLAGREVWNGAFDIRGAAMAATPSEPDRSRAPILRIWNPAGRFRR